MERDWTEYWEKVREINKNRTSCKILVRRARVIVMAPEDRQFREMAKQLGGLFRERSWAWTFPISQIEKVKDACALCFSQVYTGNGQTLLSLSHMLDFITKCRLCIIPPSSPSTSWRIYKRFDAKLGPTDEIGRGETLRCAIQMAMEQV